MVGLRLRLLSIAMAAVFSASPCFADSSPEPPDVSMRRAALRQLAELDARSWSSPDWRSAVLFVGISAAHEATGDSLYLDALARWERETRLTPVRSVGRSADALCAGQALHYLWSVTGDSDVLARARSTADSLMIPDSLEGEFGWADALFMGAPTYSMLGSATGDHRYIDAADAEWWRTTALLYDESDSLFYRDETFRGDGLRSGPRTSGGEGIFWARANGWVLAGLARVLEASPRDDPSRDRYERLFLALSERIVALQGQDGLWRPNLLAPDEPPGPDSSASALFCFGLAWGLRTGRLEGDRIERAVAGSWLGLTACMDSRGTLGWVQPVGKDPQPATRSSTSEFGVGALLLAGSEVLKRAGPASGSSASGGDGAGGFVRRLLSEPISPRAGEEHVEVAADGAWCWFGDPRAVRAGDGTCVGWVTRAGDIVVARHDHRTGRDEIATLCERLDADDHASPAILTDEFGRISVFYSAHNGDSLFFSRSSEPHSIAVWEPRRAVGSNTPGRQGYTYPNPLSSRGESLLFWRGGNWQPSWARSPDGLAWGEARTLLSGRLRAYAKYAAEEERVHVAYTDGHPQDEDSNGIWYAFYRDGRLYGAGGRALGAEPDVESGDIVYDGSLGPAWVWDVGPGPVIVYAVMPFDPRTRFGDGHHYRYARWNGSGWDDHRIVETGGPIVERAPHEAYYSGGVAIDHSDPSVVYLSRPISGVFEIERWVTTDGGSTWTSSPVTKGSKLNNIRPVVARHGSSVLWMCGVYRGYKDFETSIRARW